MAEQKVKRPVNKMTEEQALTRFEEAQRREKQVETIAGDKWLEFHIGQQLDIIKHAKEKIKQLTEQHHTALSELSEVRAKTKYWEKLYNKIKNQPKVEKMTQKFIDLAKQLIALQKQTNKQ